ncbi:MAG: hypothetical protein R3B49_04770 [Phycisphaerales bacterium]
MIGSSAPYEIGRSPGVCAATGRPLAVGERFVAVLVEPPDGALERLDYAMEAWEGGARPGRPVFAAWRAVMPEANAKAQVLIDDDELLDLFERPLAGGEGDDQVAFRYLLALVLIRRKKLVYEGGRPADLRHGRSGLMMVRPKGVALPPEGPALIEVVDPGLTEERASALLDQLGAIMNLDEDGGQA